MIDRSNGWDAVADSFIAMRSAIGIEIIQDWARQLTRAATIVDVGCGAGDPVSRTLTDEGFTVFGIDASPRLVGEYRRRFPGARVACEAAEDSSYFDRTFDAAVAIGLMFLLPPDTQETVLLRMASAVAPGGRILFSAPRQPYQWIDTLTGRESRSLGSEAYEGIMASAGWRLDTSYADDGGSHYFGFTRDRAPFIA